MKQHLWIGLLSLAAVVGGCQTADKTPITKEIQPVPINSFYKAWGTDLGMARGKANGVYVFDSVVIIYSDAGNAHVVDRQSGQLMHIHPLPTRAGALHSPAVFGDRIVYPATSALKVYSVKSGKLLRDIETAFAIRSGGVGAGQFFYIGADYRNGGRLVALDLERNDALPRWEVMTVASLRSTPMLLDGIIFSAAEDGKVRAVNEQRNSVWALDDNFDGGFSAGAVVADLHADSGVLYVASMDTKLYALNTATGKIRWQYFAGTPLREKPATTANMVYLPVKSQGLVAIAKNEGESFRKPRWIAEDAVKFLADDDKHTYVLLKNGSIAALDKANGQRKFTSKRKDFGQFGTNSKDAQIYATDRRGQLLCIRPVLKQGVVGEIVFDIRPVEFAAR